MRWSEAGDPIHNEQEAPIQRSSRSPGPSARDVVQEAPYDMTRIALIFINELSACLQLIISDIARARDLEEASARWVQHLIALAAMIERATEDHAARSSRSGRGNDVSHGIAVAYAPDALEALDAKPDTCPDMLSNMDRPELGASVSLYYGSPFVSGTYQYRPPDFVTPRLTAREHQILALANKGHAAKTIAKRLHLSVQTVRTHLRNARRKQRGPHYPESASRL